MKKLLILLLGITVLTFNSIGQNVIPSDKSLHLNKINKRFVYLDNSEKETQNDINNLKILQGQEIFPDSSSIFYHYEGDTMVGYIKFVFEDTLNIEEYYIQDSSGYIPYYKEEYHFDSQGKNTGYYITYYGDDDGNWIPDYKEDILYTTCDVAEFRHCTYGIGKSYEWNSEREDWRGESSSTLTTYDSQGRKIESANFKWDEELYDWEYTSLYSWEYNDNDKVTREIRYSWNSELDTIIPSNKSIYDYDVNDSIILDSHLEWNQPEAKWDTASIREYTYDANNKYQTFYIINRETSQLELSTYHREEYINNNGLLVRKNQYNRKNLTQSWNLYIYDEYEYNESNKLTKWFSEWFSFQMKTIYSYNAKGLLTQSAHSRKKSGDVDWALENQKNFVYDSKDNLLEQRHYYKNEGEEHGAGWKETNEYDDFGNNTVSIRSNLDTSDSTFVLYGKDEMLRNNEGQLIRSAEYNWDTTLNQWIGQYGLNEFLYEDGLLKKAQYSEWNSETNEWDMPSSIEEFFYYGLIETDELKIDSVLSSSGNDDIYSIYIYGSGGEGEYLYSIDNKENWLSSNAFLDLQPGNYYVFIKDEYGSIVEYSDNPVIFNTTSIVKRQQFEGNVFPNPFEDMLTVKVENTTFNVSVYNLMGQIIYHKEDIKSKECIQFENNENGIYLLYIYTNNECFIKKIIKK